MCTKDDIGSAVWPEYQEGIYDYQIENLVRRLRSKLEPDPANPQLLLTLRGLGYKLVSGRVGVSESVEREASAGLLQSTRRSAQHSLATAPRLIAGC